MNHSYFTTCNICSLDFDDLKRRPKSLQICHHTFCEACLKKLSRVTKNEIITCPVCREKSCINNLHTNLHALAFTKFANLLKSTEVDELQIQLDDINVKIQQKRKEINDIEGTPIPSTCTEEYVPCSVDPDYVRLKKEEETPIPSTCTEEYVPCSVDPDYVRLKKEEETPSPSTSTEEYVPYSVDMDIVELKKKNLRLLEELKAYSEEMDVKEEKISQLKNLVEELQGRMSKRRKNE